MAFREPPQPDRRGNPFDVLTRRLGRFLAVFFGLWALLAGVVSYSRIVTAENPPLAWHETATIIIIAAGATVGIAFPLALGLVEGIPMVIAHFIKQRHREEGRAEGREEGRAEMLRLWREWNARRTAAEQNGLPFTEPEPDADTDAIGD